MKEEILLSLRRLVLVLVNYLFAIYCSGQVSQPQSQGSDERVQSSSINFSEDFFRQRVYIFESIINNESGIQAGRKRYYISPIVAFKIDKGQALTGTNLTSDTTLYQIPVQFHYSNLFEQARREIQTAKSEIPPSVSIMKFQKMEFNIPNITGIRVQSLSDPVSVLPPEEGSINFLVPTARKVLFERLINSSNGLGIEARIIYNVINLSRDVFEWTVQDVQSTNAYKDLNSSGKEFVNAQQIQTIMREVFSKARIYRVTDPGMNRKLTDKEIDIVTGYLNKATQKQIEGRDEAARLDAQLIKGTGLSAQEFKPITLMWDMVEGLKTITDVKQANDNVKSFSERNRSSLNASASAGWGPFSASVGYSKGRERMDSGFFSDQSEYNSFREQHVSGTGQDARIVFRGIKLLEVSEFQSSLNLAVSAVAVEPVSQGASFTIPSSIKANSQYSELIKSLDTYIPIGTVLPFAGEVNQTNQQIKLRGGTWLPCDGRPLSKTAYPDLFNQILYVWGGSGDSFNLPDLRGTFLRGSGRNNRSVGSKEADATRIPANVVTDEKGSHTHPISTGGSANMYSQNPAISDVRFVPLNLNGSASPPSITRDPGEGIKYAGNHSHQVTGGDSETRPENVAVQYIIRCK